MISFHSPGTFMISVAAQKRGGSAILSRQVAVNVTMAAALLEADCPPVEEPHVPYFCGAVVAGNDAQVSQGGEGVWRLEVTGWLGGGKRGQDMKTRKT